MTESPPNVRLFATDLDDILTDSDSASRFKQAWESLDAERRPLLVYNAGRGVNDVKWLILDGKVPAAEFIIGANGTEVFDPIDPQLGPIYSTHIATGWDRLAVHHIVEAIPGVRLQSEEFLNGNKLSWHWPRATAAEIARLERDLKHAGVHVAVHYTSSVFLDVMPARAGKGNALAWLCSQLGIDTTSVLVAGASGNNGSMFRLPGVRGIVVANASRELFAAAATCRPFMAVAPAAAGLLAGLRHFGVLSVSPPPAAPSPAGV